MKNAVETSVPDKDFDICIDISMLLRDNIDALPLKVKANAVYIIRSSHYKKKERTLSVSYTHLTLPTILLV